MLKVKQRNRLNFAKSRRLFRNQLFIVKFMMAHFNPDCINYVRVSNEERSSNGFKMSSTMWNSKKKWIFMIIP